MMLSTVQLNAAGFEGTERINLLVDDVVVETYSLNNGAATANFETFTFTSDADIVADQIKVEFVNDQYDPVAGIDANVRLDSIVVDGVTFETEDPSVFSTGTWLPEDSIQPGFRESEILHANGFFQFAGGDVVPPTTPNVVINEIHYNPGPDGVVDGDAEFIELYNAGDTVADLSGASFTGFTLTFAQGTTLAAGEYAIVGPSIAIAQAQWGVTPIAEFADGGISGGGETIQLIAADGTTVIDEVTYDDNAPWPGAPDGNGPSLELIDPTFDNSLAESWGVSQGDPTPGAQNSIFGETGGDPITDISITPGTPLANTDFAITANIAGATTATLTYRVGFGEEVTVNMINTGGDTWTADVAGQDAGSLVRYRIDSDVGIAPFAGDTINYLGVVVQDTIADNQLPVFQFFVDEAEFLNLTTTDLALTNTRIPAVVFYDGQVIDNATVRVRGGDFSRANFPKKSLKFELPDGFTLDFGTGYPVDEFAIQADYSDWTFAATDISWDVWNAETLTQAQTQSFNLRVQNNGEFHGVFRFQELRDGAWREANGYDDAELYKAGGGGFGRNPNFDKESPDDGDFTSIILLNDALRELEDGSEAKRAYLYENINVPTLINQMALSALTRHDDQDNQNFYMALDSESGLWERIEWDLDRLWGENEDVVTPFTDVAFIDEPLMNAIFAVPEFEAMYWRRMQTLVDTYLSEDGVASLIARREELIAEIGATNSTLEFEKWGRVDIFISNYFRDDWANDLQNRVDAFAAESRLPGSASGVQNIVITELHYNPAGDDAEFIELFNNSDESVDLSGWTIDGVDLTIEYGTVILPGQHIVFTDNMPQFRGQYPGNIFVGGQYSGGLSGGGETITLSNVDGIVIDQVAYDDAAPWATAPDGDGYSLSLLDVNSDNNLASSWVASSQLNGTPGLENAAVFESTVVTVFAAGTEGDEIIALDVAGERVAVFDLAAAGGQLGDLEARNFIEFSYLTTATVDPSDVRVSFLNDSFDPITQTGRDVGIDRIEINGVAFETEDPSVLSTGTFNSAGELVPGNYETEVLQANGYFQFGEPNVADPTQLTIRAAGATGNEIISLEVAGTVVATYDLAALGGQAGDLQTGNFLELTYQSNAPINAADVRINFLNDVFDAERGIDYNVAIDNIQIGADVFETEASTTFSTGTWLPEDGVVAGFRQSEVLTNEGYFQFFFDPDANPNPNPSPLDFGNIVEFRNVDFDLSYLGALGFDEVVTQPNSSTRTQWLLLDAGNGQYFLQNVATGRYLDGDTDDIDTEASTSSTGTVWEIIEISTGQYHIRNVEFDEIVDAGGTSATVDYDPGSPEEDDLWTVSVV